jgi:hypothetical protein
MHNIALIAASFLMSQLNVAVSDAAIYPWRGGQNAEIVGTIDQSVNVEIVLLSSNQVGTPSPNYTGGHSRTCCWLDPAVNSAQAPHRPTERC